MQAKLVKAKNAKKDKNLRVGNTVLFVRLKTYEKNKMAGDFAKRKNGADFAVVANFFNLRLGGISLSPQTVLRHSINTPPASRVRMLGCGKKSGQPDKRFLCKAGDGAYIGSGPHVFIFAFRNIFCGFLLAAGVPCAFGLFGPPRKSIPRVPRAVGPRADQGKYFFVGCLSRLGCLGRQGKESPAFPGPLGPGQTKEKYPPSVPRTVGPRAAEGNVLPPGCLALLIVSRTRAAGIRASFL